MSASERLTTVVSTKGQVILPKVVRQHRGWPAGTKLTVEEVTDGVLLRRAPLFESTQLADVFAMPCRTRGAGLDVEGLGIVFLEASASGVPVIAGSSGGAPETVCHNKTGMVVDGRSVNQVADAVSDLLADPDRAAAMGAAGREWVTAHWRWDDLAGRLADLIRG